MTEDELRLDAFLSYGVALAAIRLRLVVRGDVESREDEPIDLVLLAKLETTHAKL